MQTHQRIRKKADALGLDSTRLNKKEIIHAIQIAEGNFPCFLTARRFCDQVNCCWRNECLFPSCCDNVRLQEVKRDLQDLLVIMRGDGSNKPLEFKPLTSDKNLWKGIATELTSLLQS